jgi:2,4-dienoyl-CoA reductase-like NADH-dependent reductase (Old Yellow Enzyme family)
MGELSSLYRPGSIGTLQIKNRLIMPAMAIPIAGKDGGVTDKMIAFYRARAEGGVGLVTTSFAAISPDATFPSLSTSTTTAALRASADWQTRFTVLAPDCVSN